MVRLILAIVFFLLALLHSSIACPKCTYPTPSSPQYPNHPPKLPPRHPPKVKPYPKPKPRPPKPPPAIPLPPYVKPPPFVYPPIVVKPPPFVYPPPVVKPPPFVYPPPVVKPPPFVYPPPMVKPPPFVYPPPTVGPPKGETPCPPPPYVPPVTPYVPPVTPAPPPPARCPVDALKLGACVDLLGGLIHIGIGEDPKSACCPLLQGLADLDAALCLCTTIRAKLLSINLVLPIALELLVNDCGKHLPPDYQCPA